MLNKLLNLIKFNKTEVIILGGLLLLAAVFRLYKISSYMTFLGDEGRDAMVVKQILQGDLTLLGPRASAADFFLGPVYYYMMAPFLFITKLDPVGPAIMVAIFGVATVGLVYFVGREFFGKKAAFIAASLYSVSPLVVAFSRSSWNPNLMPFFSLLLLFLNLKAVKKQSLKLFLLVGFLIGITIQLHYLTVFLGVIVFVFTLISEIIVKRTNLLKRCLGHFMLMLIGFLAGLAPFLLFEIRHGFPNIRTIVKFVFADNTAEVYSPGQSFFANIWDVFFRLYGRLVTKFPPPEQVNVTENLDLRLWQIATVLLAIFSIAVLFKIKDKLVLILLSLWLFFGVVLFGIYKKPIYDYYLGFMFPLPFLLVGNFLSQTFDNKKFQKLGLLVAVAVFGVLVYINLTGAPFLTIGNNQKNQAKVIAESILSRTDGKPYNFALITRGNSDHVYRYFLEIANREPVTILNEAVDPERKSVTDQLIVVCEYPECQPLGNSLWEVAGFGKAEIVDKWQVPFVTIFKLVHFKRPEDFSLANQKLTVSYENSELGFSFKYPDSFVFKNLTSNKERNFDNAYLLLYLATPESDKITNYSNYASNTIRILLRAYKNPENLSIEEFMIRKYNIPSINPDQTVISLLKEGMKDSDVPKEGAYVYEGMGGGEHPLKSYYFMNQNHFYELSMDGGLETGDQYSQPAETLFDEIVNSLEFK